MTQTEALKLALEALEMLLDNYVPEATEEDISQVETTINAIKAALANEALERKAENAIKLGLDYYVPCCTDQTCPKCKAALEAKDEKAEVFFDEVIYGNPYTTPPQRTWVGLTDEEMEAVANSVEYNTLAMTVYEYRVAVQKATSAKLREKNGL